MEPKDIIDAEFEVIHDPRPHQAPAVDVRADPLAPTERPVKLTMVDHITGWVALAIVLPAFFLAAPYVYRAIDWINARLFGW